MPSRYYSAIAQDTQLVATAASTDTTITLAAMVGFPSNYPYVLALDFNTAVEELVLVTGTTGGTVLSVTRGFNGSAPTSHKIGAQVRHVIVAQDLTDAQNPVSYTHLTLPTKA